MNMKVEKILDSAINLWGIPAQVAIFMEESGELVQAINKYFNRNSIPVEELASEVADVELCLEQIKRMIGTNKMDNILSTVKYDDINMTASELMSKCGKSIYSVHEYFMGEGFFEDELIKDLCDLKMSCLFLRNQIGSDKVDVKRDMKLIRLEKRIADTIGVSVENLNGK